MIEEPRGLGTGDDARNTAELLHIFKDNDLFESTHRKIKDIMQSEELGCELGECLIFLYLQ